jgi:hypothetical protein
MTVADYTAAVIIGLLTLLLVGGMQSLMTPHNVNIRQGAESAIVNKPFP